MKQPKIKKSVTFSLSFHLMMWVIWNMNWEIRPVELWQTVS